MGTAIYRSLNAPEHQAAQTGTKFGLHVSCFFKTEKMIPFHRVSFWKGV